MQWLFDIVLGVISNATSKVRVWLSAAQLIPSAIYTRLDLDTANWDTKSEFANFRFTALTAGWYQCHANIAFIALVVGDFAGLAMYVNGVAASYYLSHVSGVPVTYYQTTDTFFLTAGDFVEVWVYHDNPGWKLVIGGSSNSFFTVNQIL